MRRGLIVAAAVVGLTASAARVGTACGDKFLAIGRGARFNQVYAAIYPAAILLYAPPGRASAPALLDLKFQASLTRAGHRLQVLTDEAPLGATLEAGRFDLVLADLTDVDALRARAARAPTQPTVLPVLAHPSKAELEAVKAKYQCEIKPSDKPSRFLSVIDDEMQMRIKARAARKTS